MSGVSLRVRDRADCESGLCPYRALTYMKWQSRRASPVLWARAHPLENITPRVFAHRLHCVRTYEKNRPAHSL